MSTPDWQSLFPCESRAIDLDGLRYAYVDEGQGPTLLAVHGNPTWSFYWRNLIRGLSPHYRVLAVDHMGCGRSSKPQAYNYRLQQHVDNLSRFVEQLDLRDVTLLAHDWGGAIGLGAALAAPERFVRFVMFNTAAFRSRSMPWRIRACRIPCLGKLAVQGGNAFARAALVMAVADRRRMTPAVRAGLLAPYDSWQHRRAIQAFVEDIPMAPSHPSYNALVRIEQGLASLADRPWAFIWGMRDWCFTPAFLEQFLTMIPQAEVHRLADAGHYVVEDAHEQIVPIVERFLAEHPLPVAAGRSSVHAP
ncbi:MAG: alpha/beta fold hydrolase [Pirellulales bacterium]